MEPSVPQFAPAQPTQPTTSTPLATRRDPKLVWGLICLIGPTALTVVSILAYATANFIATQNNGASVTEFGPPALIYLNIGLFAIGAVSVITWLPGVIVGIILLATRKKHHA